MSHTFNTNLADIRQYDNSLKNYFDTLYHNNPDPWQYQTRWYEKRKRDICLAILPKSHYTHAIELGCGNGVLSELLAQRCQALISIDGNQQAVQLAKERLAKWPHAHVIQGVIPPVLLNLEQKSVDSSSLSNNVCATDSRFDLIVISEVLYYLQPNDIDTVVAWAQQNIAIGGTLLFCHWRYAIDGFAMTGETVHQRLHQAFNAVNDNDKASCQVLFNHQSQVVDSDFLLDVWQNSLNTVAMQENLI
ncbi:bifunctional 3-demethylubiquinone-9 3-methyltransferase/ 2-octaprenyl-6-hydroxy phenol methylase [Psychrobacter pasteurii]|uniref:Bifunctional 3-demethylubiquinone-9 3-methyltransferase/ 2-octaprenyl-6-hydroxy phenol methylase n=1 Tax=Psychrobacter pasteurii TaxID=1945520 RepID=A0A1R4EIK2_9GAMM|nr:SAM-dependent methyltransferase [Psychrobacter pasteurii]SJM38290.1 bifunctional 3-demethylubiquinone-9 3-methyltransferase/ 2-octaprenyl-6-hydroxy phenol methylase [Psychrobacter pasteurii]